MRQGKTRSEHRMRSSSLATCGLPRCYYKGSRQAPYYRQGPCVYDSVAVILCRQDPRSASTGVVNAEREGRAGGPAPLPGVEDTPCPTGRYWLGKRSSEPLVNLDRSCSLEGAMLRTCGSAWRKEAYLPDGSIDRSSSKADVGASAGKGERPCLR